MLFLLKSHFGIYLLDVKFHVMSSLCLRVLVCHFHSWWRIIFFFLASLSFTLLWLVLPWLPVLAFSSLSFLRLFPWLLHSCCNILLLMEVWSSSIPVSLVHLEGKLHPHSYPSLVTSEREQEKQEANQENEEWCRLSWMKAVERRKRTRSRKQFVPYKRLGLRFASPLELLGYIFRWILPFLLSFLHLMNVLQKLASVFLSDFDIRFLMTANQ